MADNIIIGDGSNNENGTTTKNRPDTTTSVYKGGIMAGDMLDAVNGFLVGLGDGFITGFAIGGKYGGAGGFGFGALAQLVGWIGSGIVGGVVGSVGGLLYGSEWIQTTTTNYRETVGSGSGVVQPGTIAGIGQAGGILSAGGSYSLDNSSEIILQGATYNNQSSNETLLLGLQSSMALFGGGGYSGLDGLSTDTVMGSETCLLLASSQ